MAKQKYKEIPATQALRDLIAFAQGDSDAPLHAATSGARYHVPGTTPLWIATAFQIRLLDAAGRNAARSALYTFIEAIAHSPGTRVLALEAFDVRFRPFVDRGVVRLGLEGKPADVLRFQAATLIQAVGADRLCVCLAPRCQRLFLKVGRRKYCSDRWQTAEYLKVFYSPENVARREAKEAEEERHVHTKKR